MNTTKTVALRTVGMVVATLLTVAVTAGPADAKEATGSNVQTTSFRDTGW